MAIKGCLEVKNMPFAIPIGQDHFAAPNAFTFFLGQRQTALGAVSLYEFDFQGERGRSYTAALTAAAR
jgi:SMODS-associated and fused to various effectors sensor domain